MTATTDTRHITPPGIATLVALSGIGALTMNVFLPALPDIADHFGAGYAVTQLALSAYLAVVAVLQLVIGPLSDRYGRRPVMLWGLVIFLVATLGMLVAPSIEIFLACRFAQAVIATGFVLSRAVVRDMVAPNQAASMIGYVTMGMSVVPMIGPAIGGWLGDVHGWRAPIWLLFGFGVIVLAMTWRDMGETNLDPSDNFSSQFRAYPELLKSRRFWGYALTAAFASGAFFAFLGGAPWVATEVFGLGAAGLGAWFGAPALGYLGGNFVSGRFAARAGLNRMMLIGGLVSTIGMSTSLVFFALGIVHPLTLFGPSVFIGIGNGITLPSANAGVVSVRPRLAGSASGLGGALMIGGGAVLAAGVGAMLTPASGAWPLIIVMTAASAAGVATTVYVIARARKVGALE